MEEETGILFWYLYPLDTQTHTCVQTQTAYSCPLGKLSKKGFTHRYNQRPTGMTSSYVYTHTLFPA